MIAGLARVSESRLEVFLLDFTNKIRLGRSRFLAEPYLAGWDREKERTGGNHAWYFSTVSPRDS